MYATSRGSDTNASVSTTCVVSPPAPSAQSYILVAVGIGTSTNTITSVTGGTGTFVKAAGMLSANRSLELWVGYNFGASQPTSITVTRTAGSVNWVVLARTIDVFADASAAPSFTASAGNTATSTAPDTNTLTPAVDDIFFAATVLASTSADSTVRTHTGNLYRDNTGIEFTGSRVEAGWGVATAAASSKEVWTTGSVEWAAVQAMWTPAAPPAATAALLVKGLTTAALDAASSF